MKFHRVLTLMLVLGSTRAWAGDLSVSIGLGPLMDLAPTESDDKSPDEDLGRPASCDDKDYSCGVASLLNIGGSLRAPFRYALTPNAAFRFGPRIDYGGRRGRVSYKCFDDLDNPLDECDRQSDAKSIYAKDHFALTVMGMLAFGPEFSVPTGDSSLYFGVELGVGAVYSFDSLEAVPINGKELNDERSPSDGTLEQCVEYAPEEDIFCPEPSSIQAVIGAEAIVGWRGAGDSPFFVEAGFSSTRVNKSPKDDARFLVRTEYLWNPVRITAGLRFSL